MSTAHKTTVSELLQKVADEQVICAEGKITKVGKFFGGNSPKDGKPYAFQEFTIADTKNPATVFTVKFNDRPEVPASAAGKVVQFLCNHSDNHGYTGVKIKEIDDWRDKTKQKKVLVLWVTKTANVIGIDGNYDNGSQAEPSQNQPAPKPALPVQPKPAAQEQKPTTAKPAAVEPQAQPSRTASKIAPEVAVKEAKMEIGKFGNLYVLALLGADYVEEIYQKKTGNLLTPEQKQGCVASLYISAQRDFHKIGAHSNLPVVGFVDLIGPLHSEVG